MLQIFGLAEKTEKDPKPSVFQQHIPNFQISDPLVVYSVGTVSHSLQLVLASFVRVSGASIVVFNPFFRFFKVKLPLLAVLTAIILAAVIAMAITTVLEGVQVFFVGSGLHCACPAGLVSAVNKKIQLTY